MDPIVLSYHDVALRKSDVSLLDDGNWLNDKIIGFMFELKELVMFLIGITGGISSGKSTVSSILGNYGCSIVDADVLSRKIMQPGQNAYNECLKEFGSEILDESGMIDRGKLGQVIFSNTMKRKKLNAITHPKIRRLLILETIKCFLKGNRYVVLDLPLLIESKLSPIFKELIVVYTSYNTQLARLLLRNDLTKCDAEARITSQQNLEEKCQYATVVIDNNGSLENTQCQVDDLIKRINQHKTLNLYEILVGVVLFLTTFIYWYYSHEVFTNCDGKIAFIDPDVVQLMRYLPKEDVKSVLSSLNLEDKELILLPINDNSDFGPGGTHWSLLVFDKCARKFQHFDSSRGSNSVPAAQVHHCLLSLDFAGELVEENAVQQTNGNDCGVHVIKTAEMLCRSWKNPRERLDMSEVQENVYKGERKRIRKLILDKLT